MENYKEIYKRMQDAGINSKDFERWLHEKNYKSDYNNNGNLGSSKESTIYYCYQSGRECVQYSSKDVVHGIRIGSLRIRIQIAHGLSAEEAMAFAKETNGHLLDGKDFSFLVRISGVFSILKKYGIELDSNFIWTAEGPLVEDMNLRRVSDASICLTGIEDADSKGAVIVKY